MRRDSSTLKNPQKWGRFMKWVQDSLRDPDAFDKVDWTEEVDKTLTYNEAIELAMSRFPGLWKDDAQQEFYNRVKQIIFIKPLVGKILNGEAVVSYRRTPKLGYYYVKTNRFRKEDEPRIILEFYRTERVDPYRLTDRDAGLAGIETVEDILALFRKWYGDPLPSLYRNWFRIVEG